MKKQNKFILLLLLMTSTAIGMLSQNIQLAAAVAPMDYDIPEPTGRYWDFNNDTLIGWAVDDWIGERDHVYNITSMHLMEKLDYSNNYYGVEMKKMEWDWDLSDWAKIDFPYYNYSLYNYTMNVGYPAGAGHVYPYNSTEEVTDQLLALLFVPKNSSNVIDTHWTAAHLYNCVYKWLLSEDGSAGAQYYADDDEIRVYNSTEGTYINMTYYDNGTLINCYGNLWLGSSLETFSYTRIHEFNPPHGVGNYWDFNNGTNIGWDMYGDFKATLMYNISGTEHLINPHGDTVDYFSVILHEIYYNTSSSKIEEYTNFTTHPVMNASMINYETNLMYPFNIFSGVLGPYHNAFLPKNTSNVLDIHWCANALASGYSPLLFGVEEITVDKAKNFIRIANNTHGTFVNLTYLDNGTLDHARSRMVFGSDPYNDRMTLHANRSHNFNPYDEIGTWNVSVGSIFYGGTYDNETKFEVTGFLNTTVPWGPMWMPVQQVLANVSCWNYTTEEWTMMSEDAIIGQANEDYVIILAGEAEDFFLRLVPEGSTGEDMAKWYEFMITVGAAENFNEVYHGDHWVKLYNSTNFGYYYFETFPSGIMNYEHEHGLYFMARPGRDLVNWYKNDTVITPGIHQVIIQPLLGINFTNEFNITIDIAVDADTFLLTSGMENNPFNVSLESGLVYVDVMLNDSSNLDLALDDPLNITIEYIDIDNIQAWFFNISAGFNGQWQEVSYTELGSGELMISVNHTSMFAINGTKGDPPGTYNCWSSDVGSPDTDGIFTVEWSNSDGADTYDIYVYGQPITEINGSLMLIASGLTNNSQVVNAPNSGTYYIAIVAINGSGKTIATPSGGLQVTILLPPGDISLTSPNAGDPDADGTFTLTWNNSVDATSYTLRRSLSPIVNPSDGSIVESGLTNNSRMVYNLASGTYYLAVVATNAAGQKVSNNVIVTVLLPPGDLLLSSDAGAPDVDGKFTLSWNNSIGAQNYSIYWHPTQITDINGSLTLLEADLTNNSYLVGPLSNGITRYFVVLAINKVANESSNVIKVDVTYSAPTSFTLSSNAGTPDDDGVFMLTWTAADGANNYSVYWSYQNISIIPFNSSVTLLEANMTSLSKSITKAENITIFYIVVAFNNYGNSTTDSYKVTIYIVPAATTPTTTTTTTVPPDMEIPFGDFYLVFMAFGIIALVIYKRRKLLVKNYK